MANILIIESTGYNCSVAIVTNTGNMLCCVETLSKENYIHSEKLHTFIEQALSKAQLSFKDLTAVAVSKGPGSYTGLRYGVSAAKGLCAALNIPLMACNPFKAMLAMYKQQNGALNNNTATMLDARRQEVFVQCFDASGEIISDVKAEIIDANHNYKNHVWIGDGADKFAGTEIENSGVTIAKNIVPSAAFHTAEACEKFNNKNFEDVAYFVPFYLKDFVATKPKVKFSIKGIPKV